MKKILGIIFLSLFLRLVLSPFGTWSGDMGSWMGWSNRLVEVGFGKFYEAWSDYLPGYMYVLFLWGNLWKILPHIISQEVFYKLPSILADGVTIYLIYLIVKKLKDERGALVSALIYGVTPAVFGNSALWGQSDSFAVLPMIISLYFVLDSKKLSNVLLSGLALGIAGTMKPSGAFVLPLFLLFLVLKEKKERADLTTISTKVILFLLSFFVIFLLAFMPFANGQDTLSFIVSRFQVTLDQYKYTSLNAFNFWAINNGGWKDDTVRFLFLTLQQWGVGLFAFAYMVVIIRFLKHKDEDIRFNLVLGSAIIFLAGFLFLTRAHERHIFPVFAFLAIAAGIRLRLWIPFVVLSIISALNLRYAYVWLSRSFEQIFSPFIVSVFSGGSIAVLGVLIFDLIRNKSSKNILASHRVFAVLASFKLKLSDICALKNADDGAKTDNFKDWKKYFAGILILGIVTRFFYLNTPPSHMFDEVYHAFTAQEMVKGNVAAWEWWNTPPEGKAYEWSHPPFAKLAMAVPLKIFGVEHAWAWRSAVALFGVGVIIMMYFVTQLLFGQRAGLIAMFLSTLDGLILTQSRIGMNDVFFVFFTLCAFWSFVRWVKSSPGRWLLLVGVSLGLSLSSKWTGVYGVGILGGWYGIILLIRSKDKIMAFIEAILKGFGFFVIVPLIIYLIIYIPFFTSGHDFSKFVELQKQMWWYHTGLKATHPFQSQFWQWPLNLRPVWFWVDYGDKTTSNIYNLGNPAIFWGGCVAVVLAILGLLRKKAFPLLFALSGFLGFWLPWAHSPRIMFFYHFFPSLMFMIMILAWVLTKIKNQRIVLGYLVIVAVLFIYFSPIWYGFAVPKNLVDQFFWIKSWR